MKKGLQIILAALTIIAMTLSSLFIVSAEGTVVFSFDSIIIDSEAETAEVLLSIEENPGFAAADIKIVCDLQIVSIQDLGVNAIVNANSGKVNWSSNTNKTTTGEILRITYAIPENAVPGESWNVSLIVTELVNSQLQEVPYSVQNGAVSIQGGETVRLAGDANNDGSVSLKDVVQIRRWLVGGWNIVINEANADVDGNNKVDLKDVVLIRRHLTDDWDVTLL